MAYKLSAETLFPLALLIDKCLNAYNPEFMLRT